LDSNTDESIHRQNDPKSSQLLHEQLQLKRHLIEWEKRLVAAERELKRLYPQHTDSIIHRSLSHDLPIIYVITPTYARPVQKADLTRLANTLLHVESLHWIVVEDSSSRSALVGRLLQRSGLVYTHLFATTPPDFKMKSTDPNWLKPRGVLQRNAGLAWLRAHLAANPTSAGVTYFADDDNTYDLQLFDEMRFTQRVSVWPVGLAGYLRYESPIVGHDGHVVGWFTAWKPRREFALDMAGFAVSTQLLVNHSLATFSYNVSRGEQETYFLRQLVGLVDLEPKANNCTQVLVWHTRTDPANLKNEDKLKLRGLQGSDPNIEV
jgi:galactosylgalactosylxylosylprotein 3-beta-glucuronosyltransferase 3